MIKKLKAHKENPRLLLDVGAENLLNSIIFFPEMMAVRPITYDPDTMVVLAGNQKLQCLRILLMEGIDKVYEATASHKSNKRKKQLRDTWRAILSTDFPESWFRPATEIAGSEEMMKEYLIKDNLHYGRWHTDLLKEFDRDTLQEWGVPEWTLPRPESPPTPYLSITPGEAAKRSTQYSREMICPNCGHVFDLNPQLP